MFLPQTQLLLWNQ